MLPTRIPSRSLDSSGPWICFLFLFLLVCVVFHPVLKAELLNWDDNYSITENPHLVGLGWQQLAWAFTDTSYMWRYQPLCWLTWETINQFFKLAPFYYHLAVLLFHAANAGLVFLLIRKLLMLAVPATAESGPRPFSLCAALAAAIWAIHPLRVETTAWAVELVFVQPLFFLLLSLLSYLRAMGEGKEGPGSYWASVVLFIASLASYPIALGGLMVYVAMDFFPLRRLSWNPAQWSNEAARRVWLEKIPFAVATLFFAWHNLQNRAHIDYSRWPKPPTLAELGVTAGVMQSFFVWAQNVWRPWLPIHLTPLPAQLIGFNPFDPVFVFSAILVIGLSVALFLQRRRWPGAFVLWLCHLALLTPMLGITERPHFPSDRYSLVVNIGWSLLLGAWLVKIWPRTGLRRIAVPVVVALLALFGVLSYRQTLRWQTNASFFRWLLADARNEPKLDYYRVNLHLRLANAYRDRGDFTNAVETLREATQLWPDNAEIRSRLADTLMRAGDFDAARASCLEALRLHPGSVAALNDLGVVYAQQGRYDQAAAQFAEVLRRKPQDQMAVGNMIKALEMQGKTNEAEVYAGRLKELQAKAPPN